MTLQLRNKEFLRLPCWPPSRCPSYSTNLLGPSEPTRVYPLNRGTVLVMCATLLLIGSCADTRGPWQHPSRPEQMRASDEADCRRRALDIVEREFRQSEESQASRDSRSSAVTAKINQRDRQRRQTDLLNRCMIDKGYVRSPIED